MHKRLSSLLFIVFLYTQLLQVFLAFSLPLNDDKTKYTVISRDKNAERSHSIKNDNSSFERVEQFRYWGTILANQTAIQEEIKSRLQ